MGFNCKGEGVETVDLGHREGVIELTYKFKIEPTNKICTCLETKGVSRYVLRRVTRAKNLKTGQSLPIKSRQTNRATAKLVEQLSKPFCVKCVTPKLK